MIEKILEKLETEMNEVVSYDEDDYYLGKYSAYGTAIRIVQEVAKEYEEKHLYVIDLNGCDDSTIFEMELTEQEYEFLSKVSELANKTSTYQCMPRLYVEQKGE